jgi:YegS/Rv2252/BmrU family lipid kinase
VAAGYQLVVSGDAGRTEDDAIGTVVRVLERGGPVEIVSTADPDRLERTIGADDDRVLVVAGGDGSLHVVVERLWHQGRDALARRRLGLVPLGTGNDFARGVGLPLDPEQAAASIVDGLDHGFDLIVDDGGGIAVNAVHVGIGAEAAEVASGFKGALGPIAYPVSALVAGLSQTGWKVGVDVDGVPVETPGDLTMMVAVANGPSIGGGAAICPPARPDDGLLDVVVVASTGPLARVSFARDLLRGEHLDRDDVVHRRGRRIRIGGDPVGHNADGELIGESTNRTYDVVPAAWTLVGAPGPWS